MTNYIHIFLPAEIYNHSIFALFPSNNYNGLIINNGSQKHNYICKNNNSPTTCFGRIRQSSGWKYSVRGKIICLI